jgi:hypothetical protein
MSSRNPLNEYHIMCNVGCRPALIRIKAINGREALTIASRQATDLQVLFATRATSTQH